MSSVFMSYSRKDRDAVAAMVTALRAAGEDVWVDLEDIVPSAVWMDEIKTPIANADSVIFVISPDSVASQVCGVELKYARHESRVLFSEVSLAVSHRRRPGVNAVAVVSTPVSVLVVAHTVLAPWPARPKSLLSLWNWQVGSHWSAERGARVTSAGLPEQVAQPGQAPRGLVGAGPKSCDSLVGGESTKLLRRFEVVPAEQPDAVGCRHAKRIGPADSRVSVAVGWGLPARVVVGELDRAGHFGAAGETAHHAVRHDRHTITRSSGVALSARARRRG